jgi:hypothetical protein
MTSPDIDGPATPDDAALAFEALVVARVTGEPAAAVATLLGTALTAWSVASRAGALSAATASGFGRRLARALRALTWPAMDPRLAQSAREARDFGISRALERLALEHRERVTAPVGRGVIPAVHADAALRARLGEAAKLATTLDMARRGNVLAVGGKANRGVNEAQGTARWTANEGINAGTAQVAREAGLNLVWVAERNACLHCLAHAGWAVQPGQAFPAVSFDPNAKGVLVVTWPPLHPSCRCLVRTYDGAPGRPSRDRSSGDPADRLAAEARRSAVYQWTDHASGLAAQRAAQALLTAGADLPATVTERARRALRKGGVRRPG